MRESVRERESKIVREAREYKYESTRNGTNQIHGIRSTILHSNSTFPA